MNSRELFLKQSLESINSDLKFAETKNTFLVTVNLAVIGAILTAFVTGKIDFTNTNRVGMLFAGLGVITLIATFFSVLSFLPLSKLDYFFYKFSDKRSEHKNGDNGDNKKENDDGKKENGDDKRKKFMFYKYIRKNYNRYDHNSYDKFQNDIRTYFELQDDISPFEKQMIIQIVDLAGIANTKFVLFSCGLLMELIAIIILAFSLVVA